MKPQPEAAVTINGNVLTPAHVTVLRCAVADLLMQLTGMDMRRSLGELFDPYRARLREIEKLLTEAPRESTAQSPAPGTDNSPPSARTT